MELHPATLFIGGIGLIALVLLTATGLSCTVYVMDTDNHPYLKFLYQLAKLKRIC